MADPRIAQKGPFMVELEKGKTYYWCQCGRSESQPFCDGSHTVTEFKPKAFKAPEGGTAALCGCKRTKNPPYCDRTHRTF
ncbi:MAG: CDGSH iron-sulfur domain-containing protein [Candidatus Izemoplasmataceae bacterium]